MKCVFCDIIEHKSEAEIIYEDDKTIAFLDIKPIHYGHILVIPKIHCNDFISIPEDYLQSLILAARKVADALNRSLKPDGYNLFANNGKAAGQSVFHFHLHITPRYFNDNIRFKLDLKNYDQKTQIKEFADRIKNELK